MLKRLVVAALAAVALAACASPKYVVSDITRFHNLPAAPAGQTFVIATIDPEQGQSLAYHQFADMVTGRLVAMGLKPFGGPLEGADYVVTLKYSVRGPSPDIQSHYDGSIAFGAGFGGRHWGGWGGYDPAFDNYTDTKQLYLRRVELDIYRGATYNTPKKEQVFEGDALSAGQNGQIQPVMPYILDALFKNFPGRSGETQRVSIEVPESVADSAYSGPSSRSSY
ncbi:MAG: DUF4136 domain-containing protein [Rhodospirillaceae bacterium]|nr:MAG: DUF4136 domain-containing protein [Rhodospirillaceae bacterium]